MPENSSFMITAFFVLGVPTLALEPTLSSSHFPIIFNKIRVKGYNMLKYLQKHMQTSITKMLAWN